MLQPRWEENMSNLQQKYEMYTALQEKNAKAMTALFSIRTNTEKEDNNKEVIKYFFEAMNVIKSLARHYAKMDSSASLSSILKKVRSVKERALSTVSSLQIALNLYDHDSGVTKDLKEELLTRVENLSETMKDPKSEQFSIENAETPHDLIRYFHQKGVDAMFDMNSCKYGNEDYGVGQVYDKLIEIESCKGAIINILDLEDKLPKKGLLKKLKDVEGYKPLKTIINLYTQKGLQKKGSEAFNVIVSSDKLLTQVRLGDHYCEIEAKINGNDDYVKFFFRDTPCSQYENAKNRTKYVVTVLKRLGFKVEPNGRETRAEWRGKKHASQMLKEVLRLNVSTKDLDLYESCIQKYPKRAVNAFLKGKTNIWDELMKWDSQNKDDDPKIDYPSK